MASGYVSKETCFEGFCEDCSKAFLGGFCSLIVRPFKISTESYCSITGRQSSIHQDTKGYLKLSPRHKTNFSLYIAEMQVTLLEPPLGYPEAMTSHVPSLIIH